MLPNRPEASKAGARFYAPPWLSGLRAGTFKEGTGTFIADT